MNLFGFNLSRKADLSIDEVIRRLEAVAETTSGVTVTPENCEEAPTVQAIVNAISTAFVALAPKVYRETTSNGRTSKELLPNHPVAKLLANPNEWQTPASYWQDLASCLTRHGRYLALKSRGLTGPIRRLWPIHPNSWTIEQDVDSMDVLIRATNAAGRQQAYTWDQVHHVRSRSRDFLNGDSPVWKCRDAIALEIAAQRFGGSFFGNGAQPGLIFKPKEGRTMGKEQRETFAESVQALFSRSKRFRALVVPAGLDLADPLPIENDKAQFLETRKLQRSVIAGAWGVPPHLVGDLERGTFSNIEHQSLEFQSKVVLPYAVMTEDGMERDLLTAEDRAGGVVIRFDFDATLRVDFKTRQEGRNLQRLGGVINANDWRQGEGMNPRTDEGGETYFDQGPSGQNMGATPTPAPKPRTNGSGAPAAGD